MEKEILEIWIGLAKFFLGTVVVGLITFWVNSGFKDREIALTEQHYLANFKDEALSQDVEVRKRLAEYFSRVTISDEARARWADYLMLIESKEEERDAKAKKENELLSEISALKENDTSNSELLDEKERELKLVQDRVRMLERELQSTDTQKLTYSQRSDARICGNYLNAGKDQDAVFACDDVLRRDPQNLNALALRCQAHSSLGNVFLAVQDCTKVTALDETYDLGRFARGLMYDDLGFLEEAKRDYEYVLANSNDRSVIALASNNWAWMEATCDQKKNRDGERAVELALRANEASSYRNASRLDTLAAAYANLGLFDKAKDAIDRAVNLAPGRKVYIANREKILAYLPVRTDCEKREIVALRPNGV